jgi:hypothetical protein
LQPRDLSGSAGGGTQSVSKINALSISVLTEHGRSTAYRELIHFGSGFISSITIVPDFGRLLVLSSGSLWAFDLTQMIPTHEPVTWTRVAGRSGVELSGPEHTVAFVRMGMTKGRLLSESM